MQHFSSKKSSSKLQGDFSVQQFSRFCCQKVSKWQQESYRILVIGSSGSGKTNVLLNLIDYQPDIDKYICMLKIRMKKNINI